MKKRIFFNKANYKGLEMVTMQLFEDDEQKDIELLDRIPKGLEYEVGYLLEEIKPFKRTFTPSTHPDHYHFIDQFMYKLDFLNVSELKFSGSDGSYINFSFKATSNNNCGLIKNHNTDCLSLHDIEKMIGIIKENKTWMDSWSRISNNRVYISLNYK